MKHQLQLAESQTVADFNRYLTRAVTTLTPIPIEVTGTLSGWRPTPRWANAELIHTSDTSTIAARLRIGIPGELARRTQKTHPDPIQDGITITITGTFQYHRVFGLQLIANDLAPHSRKPPETIAQERLQKHIIANDLGAHQRNLVWPSDTDRIAIITPATGDASRTDIITVLERTGLGYTDYRTRMSGPGAATHLANLVTTLAATEPAICITRGGGAKGDIDTTFNNQTLVKTIATCPVPIVVGIGHATDTTLTDLVAHHNATTPTGAAEWVANHCTISRPLPETITIETPVTDNTAVIALAASIVLLLVVVALIVIL